MNKLSRVVDAILRFFRKNKYFTLFALFVAGVIAIATFKDSIISLRDLVKLKQKASADVAEIESIKKQVQADRDTIQMVVRDANALRREIEPIAESVNTLDAGITEASRRLDNLYEEQMQIASVGHAEAFDRNAFRELATLASGTNRLAALARATVSKVQRTLILDRANTTALIPLERRGQERFTGPFSTDELAMELHKTPADGAINIIGQKKYRLFVPELVQLAEHKDLWTANRVSKALHDIAGVSFDPWNVAPLHEWWAENESSFTNWPYESYNAANAQFSACNYQKALDQFGEVLSVDPAADRSRALSVACALELNDITTATNLSVAFVHKEGRWERWADCKMLLATGEVSEATQAFAELAKEYPTFSDNAWIRKGNHVLRRIDWPMYEKAMKEEKTSNKAIDSDKK